MDIIGLTKNRPEFFMPMFVAHSLMLLLMGCASAEAPNEYRESQGKITKFTVEQTDPFLHITWFVKLQDGTVIRPNLYYYQVHKTLIGVRQVEKSSRTAQTIFPDGIKNFLYLPTSKEINVYFLLVRRRMPREVEENGEQKIKYVLADWQLLEIKSEDLVPEKPIVFPAFEELMKRELSDEQRDILKGLVKRYDIIAEAARVKANTPVKHGDKRPWWTW